MRETKAAQEIALFSSQISNRRFDDETLAILESILVSKDVRLLMESRSSLREFMRSESLSILHEIADKTVDLKLSVLQFFVRAFAIVGDIESCLAMKYEAFLLRELKSTSYDWLQVSNQEWVSFAQVLLDNGFYSIAIQACEKALLCLQKNNVAEVKPGEHFDNAQMIEKTKRLKDQAVKFAVPGSVQALAAEYLKRKEAERWKTNSSVSEETQCVASTLFRNGIKKRNEQKLRESQKYAAEVEP